MHRLAEWAEAGLVLSIPRDVFEKELVRPLREEGYHCPRRVEGEIIATGRREDDWVVLEVKTHPPGEIIVRVEISPEGDRFSPGELCTACSWRQVNVVLDFFQRHIGEARAAEI